MNKPITPGPGIGFAKTKSNTAIHLVQSSQFAQRLARLLIAGLICSIIAMAALPWQQTSRGSGQVVAFVPQERQQSIEAPFKGVIAEIGGGLQEGSRVSKGQVLIEIQPFAANELTELEGQKEELEAKLEAAENKARATERMKMGYTKARDFAVSAAQQLVESAQAKLEAKQELIRKYTAAELQTRLNFERQKSLFDQGVKPKKEIEKLQKEWDGAAAELEAIYDDVQSLEKQLAAKNEGLGEKQQKGQTDIEYANALLSEAEGKVFEIRKEIRQLRVKRGKMERTTVLAPRAGTIFRMPITPGQSVKEGQSLMTLVPDTSQKAVELLINGNDWPLVKQGQEVRLQFEGWPAVQFAGWPSVAVGTFSGRVATIDETDSGKGQFRVLVLPNEQSSGDQAAVQWPDDQYLRQGVRANGWVMINRVKLGYEIWRQLNGFPIMLSKEPDQHKTKLPKLPKQ